MSGQVSYTSITENRGRSRLWLEGAKLSTAGFTRGARYRRVFHEQQQRIELILAADGDYVVSGRARNGVDIPIIDLSLGVYLQEMPIGTRVRAVFIHGSVTITIHHEEQAKTRREERFLDGAANGDLTEASACTGGGISTSAIHAAIADTGLSSRVAFVVDCELKYLQSAFHHCPAITDDTVCFEARLEELEPELLPEVDLFSFSLPCSGFSKSGTSKHGLSPEEHDGGTSVFGVMNIIRAANPAVIISENVPEAQGSPIYVLIQQELKRRGYEIVEAVLDSQQTGTFENRRRYWFIAYSSGLPAELFRDAFEFQFERQYAQLSEILVDSVPDERWADNQYLKDKQVRDAAAGKGFAQRQLLTGVETRIGTIGRHYMKRRSTEPFIVNADGKERLLYPEEHARCKSVPVALIKDCAETTAHEILGQGIDYLQAYLPIKRVMQKLRLWLLPELAEAV